MALNNISRWFFLIFFVALVGCGSSSSDDGGPDNGSDPDSGLDTGNGSGTDNGSEGDNGSEDENGSDTGDSSGSDNGSDTDNGSDNGEGTDTGNGSDDNAEDETGPGDDDHSEETLPELASTLTAGNQTLSVDWNESDFIEVTFNACVASEPLDAGIDNCASHTDSQYFAEATSPLTIEDLQNGTEYWVQVEATTEGDNRVVSEPLSDIPYDPDASPTGEPAEVISYNDLGNNSPSRIMRVGHYAVIAPNDSTAGFFWTSLGDPENSTRIELPSDYKGPRWEYRLLQGDHLYFPVQRHSDHWDIWVTDGTEAGTTRVVDGEVVGLNAHMLGFIQLAATDNHVAFMGTKSAEEPKRRIYILDKDAVGGAAEVLNFEPHYPHPRLSLAGYNGFFFAGHTQAQSHALYRINPGLRTATREWDDQSTTPISRLIATDNHLYFSANEVDGHTLWSRNHDGVINRMFDAAPDDEDDREMRDVWGTTAGDTRLFFFTRRHLERWSYTNNLRLAVTAGTEASTRTWWNEDILGRGWTYNHIDGQKLPTFGDNLLFRAPNPNPLLWISNGMEAGTRKVIVDGEPLFGGDNSTGSAWSVGESGYWFAANNALLHLDAATINNTEGATAPATEIPFETDLRELSHFLEINGAIWFAAREASSQWGRKGVWRIAPEDRE